MLIRIQKREILDVKKSQIIFKSNLVFCVILEKISHMKKTLLSLTLCVSLFNAQTTITKAFHDPSVGDVANNINLAGTPDNSATGINTIFNNSSLTQGSGVSGTYSTPSSAEISSYPGSTLKYVNGSTNVFYIQTA